MPGTNAGTGQPNYFRCAKCRRQYATDEYFGQFGTSHRGRTVVLTGRDKLVEASGHGIRMSQVSREYRCEDCGHVGWSRHMDLDRQAFRCQNQADGKTHSHMADGAVGDQRDED